MTTTVSWRAITAAFVILCTATLSGCASAGTPSGGEAAAASAQRWSPQGSGPQGRRAVAATALPVDLAGLDRGDPDATARAVLQIWFSWNPNVDSGPNDAAARSAPLLSAQYRSAITSTGSLSPGARWLEWAARHASAAVRVDASTEAVPPQTSRHAVRAYQVTQTWFSPSGELLDTAVFTAGIQLLRNGTAWEVNRVEQR
ncbi:hypothetical protein [Nocardia noduli]|uniref:hypothetical protein n=1 Tax=Nocardia noduli TaxID=2815722 RepID=UPI001C240B4E|nr:hypothetical protein [Nocardia noduli]